MSDAALFALGVLGWASILLGSCAAVALVYEWRARRRK